MASAPAAPRWKSSPADYEAFERLLGDVQAAWSNEDVGSLEKLTTPEMASYFAKDLADNKARNDVNKISDVKLLQGDLAEAWREGETDYASVAMRFSLVDKTLERSTGKLVAGSEQPIEATEVWTFARRRGTDWELSAIQQTSLIGLRRTKTGRRGLLRGAFCFGASSRSREAGILAFAAG